MSEISRGHDVPWSELRERLQAFVSHRVQDRDTADDIVQEVLLRIDRGLDSLEDETRLLPWVYQVTRNSVIDHYRAGARNRELPSDPLPQTVLEECVDDPVSDTRAELAACLEPMLEALAPRYRRALELTELSGRAQAEAARELGISVSGMKSRVQRARAQLAREYHRCCRISFDARNAPVEVYPRSSSAADPDSDSRR
jgi:RNA polymerase sigma-70 factor (ECF subfamily)